MTLPHPVVDCLVHPVPITDDVLRSYVDEAWREQLLPRPYSRGVHPPPIAEYLPGAEGEALPCTDPMATAARLRAEGVDIAVLTPLSRGLLQNDGYVTEVAAATNRWLAETWLDAAADAMFFGSIRVNARDTPAALAEIERWGSHPRFAQVVVTTEAIAPYGEAPYFPIWEAASAHRLPVMVVSDRARGIQPSTSPFGHTASFVEEATLIPWSNAQHLGSLICEGVFERLPELTVLFGDGGFDMYLPAFWRLIKDWRALRHEMPWVRLTPMEYVRRNARFVVHPHDGGPEPLEQVAGLYDIEDTLLYGSRYPYWDSTSVAEAAERIPDGWQERFFGGALSAVTHTAT